MGKTPDDILVNLNARVSRSLWREARLASVKHGVMLRKLITDAIAELLRTASKRTLVPRAAPKGDTLVQLATRVPKWMHRELKLLGVNVDLAIMELVAIALGDAVDAAKAGKKARGAKVGSTRARKKAVPERTAAALAS